MNRPLFSLLGLAIFFAGAALQAQAPADTGRPSGTKETGSVNASGILEADRLMQQYMAKRAELVALRNSASEQTKGARNEVDRKRIQSRLEEAERPLVAETVELARQYREAKKQTSGASARKPE